MQASPARLRARYQKHFTSLSFSSESALFVGEEGDEIVAFACLVLDQVDSITMDRQAYVFDLVSQGDPVAFLTAIEKAGLDLRADYLVTDLPFGLKASEAALEGAGYAVSLNKIARLCQGEHTLGLRAQRTFPVRLAERADHPFILLVSNLCAQHLIPPGRDERREEIERGFLEVYSGLDIVNDPELTVFIAEDPARNRPSGYLMLRYIYRGLGNARKRIFGYIYDVSVHPDYWGTQTLPALQGAAEMHLVRTGIPAIVGEVSEANPRALRAAQKLLGYTIESRKYSKRL